MWGYALLGVATWLLAPIFNRSRVEKITAALMVANGVVSIIGGFVTAWSLGWVLTTPGVISYVGWNILVLALSIFVMLSLRQRQAASR
jgi:thiol:disulfide interchange protein